MSYFNPKEDATQEVLESKRSRLRTLWGGMKSRCYAKQNIAYKHYGERGITVCDEWLNDFENFYEWAITHGYCSYLTIDRIDVNGNYEPSNCRWVSQRKQANNKRNTIYITCYGQRMTLTEAARKYGLDANWLRRQYQKPNFDFDKL